MSINMTFLNVLSLKHSAARRVLFRRMVMMCVDALLIIGSVIGAFALRLREQEILLTFLTDQKEIIALALICGIPVLYFSGWYRGLTRYAGSYSLYSLLPRSVFMVFILLLVNSIFSTANPPRSFWILYWILFTGSAISCRIIFRDLLLKGLGSWDTIRKKEVFQKEDRTGTLIYGAGSSGVALLLGLRNDPKFKIIGFVDDDPTLHGRTLQNLPISSPTILPYIHGRYGVTQVLLAMPSMPRERKRQLVDQLSHNGFTVLSIPSISQLASGQRQVSDLKPVAIEDLLGREPSIPDPNLLTCSVNQKNVLVTGAGGSIGSELCRQIVKLGCCRLIVFERNEFALYNIHGELVANVIHHSELPQCSPPLIIPILGDAADRSHLLNVCRYHNIQTIFHAAAYKHVPMVEANICSGVANNILATKSVIEASKHAGVERVTLISTDKAVRPTNAMGASKRICELLFQVASRTTQHIPLKSPIFSMVRFGNVLGSSGSVIPLFHQQIANGGPITVTHPNITRYFMTIPEAVALVLQATGMARGGDLFLLDMGEPVRIADLARQMVELSGLRVRDRENPDGDIEIIYSGLRPGEKLYEELLLTQQHESTDHPLIRRATEPISSDLDVFDSLVRTLIDSLNNWDERSVIKLLSQIVPEYTPENKSQSHYDEPVSC